MPQRNKRNDLFWSWLGVIKAQEHRFQFLQSHVPKKEQFHEALIEIEDHKLRHFANVLVQTFTEQVTAKWGDPL